VAVNVQASDYLLVKSACQCDVFQT